MATTKIADLIEPSVYLNYMQEELPEKNRFVRMGILASPPEEVTSQMNAGGSVIDMPYWNDLTRGEPDIMSDDDSTESTPDKITAEKDRAVKHYWHKSWSNMDLSGLVATGDRNDPVKVVLDRFGEWWIGAEQRALINSCKGVFADNSSNFSSDMIYSVYSDISSPTAANKISQAAVDRARLTMGDSLNDLVAIAVHSTVYGDMLDNDAIDFIQESQLPGRIPTFMNLMVIVDDQMPVTTGSNTDKYTCYLFGRGAFASTDGALDAEYAFERDRNPEKGNGGGQTVVHTRRHTLLHPRGIKFDGTPAGKSPTFTELADGANWTRVYERKNIRLAALEVNAG